MTKRKTIIWLITPLVLATIGYSIYKTLFPGGADLTPVPNPIRDRATIAHQQAESDLPTNPLKNAFFGDLHVHTSLSFDAYIGGTVATPSDAYHFAKGGAISIFGQQKKLKRPLDFAAVTDHSEFIGEYYSAQTKGAPGYYSMAAQTLRGAADDEVKALALFQRLRNREGGGERTHMGFFQGFETTKLAWDMILAAAETHYEPGKFSTLVGYEWSAAKNGGHIHRNVFFRDMVVPDYPISAIEARTAEDLWASLAKYEEGGATVLAIPHNTNLSKGFAFPDTKNDGQPLDANYLKSRQNWEPLVEIHQAKGNSEVHAQFWQNDEYADFENFTYLPAKKNTYVRYALKKGLVYQHEKGINPYKFGFVGSTDTHNATPGVTEETEPNQNHTRIDLNADDRRNQEWVLTGSQLDRGKKVYEAVNPGGLVGVWAPKNTRGEIWDALKRKETFATSGGRIKIRFFGGYDFAKAYDSYEALVKAGYEVGVSMGSDLPPSTDENKSPSFLIWATKDAESANLDRVQIIKGWYKNGNLEEKIYNVAVSDNRMIQQDGSVASIEASVDLKKGAWDKTKGATTLQTVWTDPDFDPQVEAFYYARVLELSTARYNLWDEIKENVAYPADAERAIQERAWSSPIRYTPK
ncbi:MAG: DUF3604 domain-containing protein [Bacteroidota bacterium]